MKNSQWDNIQRINRVPGTQSHKPEHHRQQIVQELAEIRIGTETALAA